jgi:hypothetical protein
MSRAGIAACAVTELVGIGAGADTPIIAVGAIGAHRAWWQDR